MGKRRMNLSIFLVVFGGILLFVPQIAWLGIALLAVGAVAYTVTKKGPLPIAQAPPRSLQAIYPEMFQRPQAPGVSVTQRDPMAQKQKGPYIKDGMFNLPLPIDDEVARFVDLNYKVPTKAKGVTQGMEKRGNPWLPKF